MAESFSLGELCFNAKHNCMVTGLHPVQWRWSQAVWLQFECMIAYHYMSKTDLPPGCLGIYEGLPIYRMALPHPAVACVGARVLPPGF